MNAARKAILAELDSARPFEPAHPDPLISLNRQQRRRDQRDPQLLDLIARAASVPAAREWIVENLMPAVANVLLAAHGGRGKSALALMLAVCIALGKPFFGMNTAQAVVVMLSAEDDADELHRRLIAVCRALKVNMASLAGKLCLYDAVGCDIALFGRRADINADGKPMFIAAPDITARFEWLKDCVEAADARVLILDSTSDMFDAGENIRPEVRRYLTACLGLVMERRGCVIHVSHVDKMAARGGGLGNNYSGSTAWNNSVRVRLALMLAARDDDLNGPDDGRRLLVVEKINYGRPGLEIPLRFDPEMGVFVRDGDPTTTGLIGAIRDRTERRTLLQLIQECQVAGRSVLVSPKANDNAPTMLMPMESFPRSLRGGQGRKRLFGHLSTMEADGLIVRESFRTASRKPSERWAVTTLGVTESKGLS